MLESARPAHLRLVASSDDDGDKVYEPPHAPEPKADPIPEFEFQGDERGWATIRCRAPIKIAYRMAAAYANGVKLMDEEQNV